VEAFRETAGEARTQSVKLLIDTNVIIWWMADDPALGRRARALLSDPSSIIFASLVSIWEITMKWRVGKLPAPGSTHAEFLTDEGATLLDITTAHFDALEALPQHHKDPFDHLLIAQAQVEGARILTSDREMTQYGVPCFPAGR
jgi:PIN domain nuclease of toxin-antitoxin system